MLKRKYYRHIFSDTLLCIKIVKLNIFSRPEEAMFDNWQKLVSLYKYLVLFLRKLKLHGKFTFSNFNLSLEFDESLFLLLIFDILEAGPAMNLTTKVFPSFFTYLQLICMEIPSLTLKFWTHVW